MVYNNNVPQAQQTIAFTQPIINTNFATLATEQKVNHTFTDTSGSNAIAGEADGSHQKLNFPNQAADITGVRPTGIGIIQYAKGDAIYAWDGTQKCAMSAVVKSGVELALGTTFVTIDTPPVPCIGYLILWQTALPVGQSWTFATVDTSPALAVFSNAFYNTPSFKAQASGFDLQIGKVALPVSASVTWKIIYWPI